MLRSTSRVIHSKQSTKTTLPVLNHRHHILITNYCIINNNCFTNPIPKHNYGWNFKICINCCYSWALVNEQFGQIQNCVNEQFGEIEDRVNEQVGKIQICLNEPFGKIQNCVNEQIGKIQNFAKEQFCEWTFGNIEMISNEQFGEIEKCVNEQFGASKHWTHTSWMAWKMETCEPATSQHERSKLGG